MKITEQKDSNGNRTWVAVSDTGRHMENFRSKPNWVDVRELEEKEVVGEALLSLWKAAGSPEPQEITKQSGVTSHEVTFRVNEEVILCISFSSEYAFRSRNRIGERFSGLGSSDGMRDDWETVTVRVKDEYSYPHLVRIRVGRADLYGKEAKEKVLSL